MNKLLRRLAPGLALGTVLLSSSCAKKSQDTPAPTVETPPGPSITGLVRPADAVLAVSLVNSTTHQGITGATPDNTGAYHFDALPAGTYELYFIKKAGYVPPRQLSVTVATGKTTVAPTATALQSTASLTADSVSLPSLLTDLSLAYDGDKLPAPGIFSLILSDGNPNLLSVHRLFLSMPYAVSAGTYSLNGASTYAVFYDPNAGIFDSRLNPPTVTSGGKLVITSVENVAPFPRSVSGTFSFIGTSAAGTQETISGSFDNAYF